MDTEEQYCFHLTPELRHLMLLSSKPPTFPAAADNLYSVLPAAGACREPKPPFPDIPPPAALHPLPARKAHVSKSDNGDCGGRACSSQGRWPRQETLTLLDIRTRLDPQFREAGQKAPLWDEVARIMAVEYGYQRSGRKCREKLDNLYKYYKKTKESKIGRPEAKHYRFFRQLEALYGATSAAGCVVIATHSRHPETAPFAGITANLNLLKNPDDDSLFFSTSGESSGEDDGLRRVRRRRGGMEKGWKAMIAELVEAQMKRLMAVQDAWFEKMMRNFERMEDERVRREESRRREEAERRAREASLLDALERIVWQQPTVVMAPAPAAPATEEDEEYSEEMECGFSRARDVLRGM